VAGLAFAEFLDVAAIREIFSILMAQQAAQPAGPPFWVTMVIMLAPIVVLYYLLLVRPEQKRQRERQRMLNSLEKNDHVVTIGGIKGVVTQVKPEEDEVIIRVDDHTGTRLRVTRSSILKIEKKETEKKDKEAEKEKAKEPAAKG
jgi:preprotein translocase subunit YajC